MLVRDAVRHVRVRQALVYVAYPRRRLSVRLVGAWQAGSGLESRGMVLSGWAGSVGFVRVSFGTARSGRAGEECSGKARIGSVRLGTSRSGRRGVVR